MLRRVVVSVKDATPRFLPPVASGGDVAASPGGAPSFGWHTFSEYRGCHEESQIDKRPLPRGERPRRTSRFHPSLQVYWLYFAGDSGADINKTGGLSPDDIFAFLAAFYGEGI